MPSEPPVLKTLLGDYANTRALRAGRLPNELFSLDYDPVKTPNRAFKRVVRELSFDVAELALVTYLQARAYGKPLVLMPAVIGAGRHQHHCLVCHVDRPLTASQLQGRRVGIRAYAQTTVTWVRGIVSDDYGVNLDGVHWVTAEDGHLAEFPDPAGVVRDDSGRNAFESLVAGDLDAAIIGTDLPDDPRLVPILPQPHQAAQAWAQRHGLIPINHMVVVREDLCRKRPDIVRAVYQTLLASKAEADAQRPSDQPDLTPFGVEPNRQALEVLIRYAHEQRLIPRRFSVDEIFEDFHQITGL
jgi:4,5-dihydroxyphthalate decarboxylase